MNDTAEYVREIERYLCQRNGGHLVRIVGPSFELVSGWARRGVPLKVALGGIDRCCVRYDARGARRRPVRIEFCEADVLDVFDEWRRAVGVGVAGAPVDAAESPAPRKPTLVSHIERALARLAHTRGREVAATPFERQLDETIAELERMLPRAPRARGDERETLVARLAELDAGMMAAAISSIDPPRAAALREEAALEVAPFGSRMTEDVRLRAVDAAYRRLLRESCSLPTLAFE